MNSLCRCRAWSIPQNACTTPRFLSFFALDAVCSLQEHSVADQPGQGAAHPCLLLSGCLLPLCLWSHLQLPWKFMWWNSLVLGRSGVPLSGMTVSLAFSVVLFSGGLSQWEFGVPAQTRQPWRQAQHVVPVTESKCQIQNNWRVMCVSIAEAELTVGRGLCSTSHRKKTSDLSFPLLSPITKQAVGEFPLLYLWNLSQTQFLLISAFCYLLISSTVHQMLFSHCDFQSVF